MKVCGGSHAGRKLLAPRGATVRPLLARAKTSLFDTIGALEGHCVLDLFSGSGALGIEALSRGARRVLFLERDKPALKAIAQNLENLGFPAESWRILRRDLLRKDALRAVAEPFTGALLAPPFAVLKDFTARPRFDALLAAVCARLPADGWAAVQFASEGLPLAPPAGAREAWRKSFGRSVLITYRPA